MSEPFANVRPLPGTGFDPDAFERRVSPVAKRFSYRPSEEIPPRPWQYPRTFLRKYLTVTVAPGGVGKSTLAMVEALALGLGLPLMGVQPIESGPVLIFNGEDPEEEIEMRLAACIEHLGPIHGFQGRDVEACLHFQSGRGEGNDWTVIRQHRDGLEVCEPKVDAIKDYIRENGIVHLVVDPFISTHEVNENDNPAINAAASLWVNIAHETDCSIHLIHHAKKTNGAEVTEESSRGAKALTDKARITRFLQPMSEEQAKAHDVNPADRFEYVRMNDGKVNLHKRSGAATWFRLIGVPLGNGEVVQTCVPWSPPDTMQGVRVEHLQMVQAKARAAFTNGRPLKASVQAADYAGKVIAETIGLDWTEKPVKAKVAQLLRIWTSTGALERQDWFDARQGREVPVIVAGSGDVPSWDTAE